MSTLDQVRHGMNRVWGNLAEGWHQMRERAGEALTRFTPRRPEGELQPADEALYRGSARWGLLAAEVEDAGDDVRVCLEVPGMNPDGFDVQVVDDYLVVRGEKSAARSETRGRYHVMERAYGRFERAIPLPCEVQEAKAKARYRRGVLTVTLPKSPLVRPRRVEVDAG